MLVTKNKEINEKNVISKRTYVKDRFFGPYLDFIEMETEEGIVIELDRNYFEDSKYANVTRLELAVKLLYEVSKENDKPIYLKIWGTLIEIHNSEKESEIHQKLSEFILKNVSF